MPVGLSAGRTPGRCQSGAPGSANQRAPLLLPDASHMQKGSQFLIDRAPGANENNIESRRFIVHLVNDPVCSDSKGSIAR
jgi:hypothetical protein